MDSVLIIIIRLNLNDLNHVNDEREIGRRRYKDTEGVEEHLFCSLTSCKMYGWHWVRLPGKDGI